MCIRDSPKTPSHHTILFKVVQHKFKFKMKPFKSVGESFITAKSSPLKQLHNISPSAFSKRTVAKENTSASKKASLSQLKAQHHVRHRGFDELNPKSNGTFQSFRGRNSSLEKELGSNRATAEKAAEEKRELELKLAQSKEYIRKLEFTITSGAKGKIYSQAHEKVVQEMRAQGNKIDALNTYVQELQSLIREKDSEINSLKASLNIHASELKIKGGLLYELGTTRNKLQQQSVEFIRVVEEASKMRRQVFALLRRIAGGGKDKKRGVEVH
eukprot:TRINITY_DN12860_c0_g1_i2.p2 TRINITY_DN12860_c0_g1~~TRINITY_DN12860_c0_g1_i2.p2  ORF type:complete len:271 (+),score=48.00 TRINITY_DN12860_c0_g1_i2:71-883(+)